MTNKKMYFIDEINNSLIEVFCLPKNKSIYNYKTLKNLAYCMKLDGHFNESKTFKKNKTTGDLIDRLDNIINDNIIDLSNLEDVIADDETLERKDIKTLLTNFLSLFEYKKIKTYKGEEMEQLINHLAVPTITDTKLLKKIVISSKYNTKVLNKLKYDLSNIKEMYPTNPKILSYGR